jgi:DNA mismatch endonuclease, patch repair protein
MPDKFPKETRSKIMKAIKSTGTKLEVTVMDALEKRGYRFVRNDKELTGKPDLSFKEIRTVVFVDSCFWHGCPIHYKRPKSNQEYWDKKFERNRARDEVVNQHYIEEGWGIMRVWEHELKEDFDGTIEDIIGFIEECREASLQ